MTTRTILTNLFTPSVSVEEESSSADATLLTTAVAADINAVAAADENVTAVATATVPALDPSVDAEFKEASTDAGELKDAPQVNVDPAPVESPAEAAAEPLGAEGEFQAEVVDGAEVAAAEASEGGETSSATATNKTEAAPAEGETATATATAASTENDESSTIELTPVPPVVEDPAALTEGKEPETKPIGEGVVELIVEEEEEIVAFVEIASIVEENEKLVEAATVDIEQSEQLEEYVEALENLASKAITESDVAMFKLSIEAFALQCGIEGKDLIPSIESMSADQASVSLSLEEAKSLAISVEAGIFDGIRKVISGIGKAFAWVFKSYGSILNKVKELRAKAKEQKDDAVRDITVSNLHRLHVNGKIDPSTIIKGLSATAEVSEEIYGNYNNAVKKFYQDMAANFISGRKSWIGKAWDSYDIEGDFGASMQKRYGALTRIAEHNPEFSGGYVFAKYRSHDAFVPYVFKKDDSISVTSKQTVKSLSNAQVNQVLDNVEKIISIVKKRSAAVLATDSTLEALINSWAKDATDYPGFFSAIRRAVNTYGYLEIINNLYSGRLLAPTNQVSYAAFGAVTAAVGYVSKSLK